MTNDTFSNTETHHDLWHLSDYKSISLDINVAGRKPKKYAKHVHVPNDQVHRIFNNHRWPMHPFNEVAAHLQLTKTRCVPTKSQSELCSLVNSTISNSATTGSQSCSTPK